MLHMEYATMTDPLLESQSHKDRHAMENSGGLGDSPGSTSGQDTTPLGTPRRMPMLTDSRGSSGETPSSGGSFTSSHSPEEVAHNLNPAKCAGPENDRHSLTPTLHASLVSQILSLRREVDSSHDFIQRLEDFLAVEKAEKDSLQEANDSNGKELRNVKRQLQSVEDASLLALEELCRERDDAHDTADMLRLRLQEQQKKVSAQQNEINYLHEVWEQERLAWKQDKRRMELKIEIAAARLRAVTEHAAAHDVALREQEQHEEVHKRDSLFDENEEEGSGFVTCFASPNRESRTTQRASVGSVLSARRGSLLRNMSLADELKDRIEDDPDFDDQYELDSPSKTAREVRFSGIGGVKARAVDRNSDSTFPHSMIFSNGENEPPFAQQQSNVGEEFRQQGADADMSNLVSIHGEMSTTRLKNSQDTSRLDHAQSPVGLASAMSSTTANVNGSNTEQALAPESSVFETKQAQKHELGNNAKSHHNRAQSEPVQASTFAASNHVGTPPQTLESVSLTTPTSASEDRSTTEIEAPSSPVQSGNVLESKVTPQRVTAIPLITIHPPSSRPESAVTHSMSPWIKDVGCQTEPYLSNENQSAQAQPKSTEFHQRSVSLPVTISSPNSYNPVTHDNEPRPLSARESITSLRSRNSIKRLTQRIREIRDYHNRNDSEDPQLVPDMPEREPLPDLRSADPYSVVDEGHWARLRKSLMLSGRYGKVPDTSVVQDFAGMEREAEDLAERSHRSQQRMTRARVNAPTPVPEEGDEVQETSTHDMPIESKAIIEKHRLALSHDRHGTNADHSRPGADFRAFFRRPGSSSSYSIASSSGWSRSTGQVQPPHVIPARNSSMSLFRRRGRTDGYESPTPRSSTMSPQRREPARLVKKSTLRKTRSAAMIADSSVPNLSKSRSFASERTHPAYVAENKSFFGHLNPPRLIHSSGSSPQSPTLPFDFHPLVTTTSIAPTASPNMLQHSIVDAITATMVGEWMWKYVRKRKTFSFAPEPLVSGDGSGVGGGSAVRHKRWVWLSPYDRTVLWSNKQPITDVALMGKQGRKLQIQSVLDVADPPLLPRPNTSSSPSAPKVAPFPTNRSIVILTPTGALKFTATSPERHYLWLTALSFLSQHTSQDAPDLSFLPPGPRSMLTNAQRQAIPHGSTRGGVEKKRLWGRNRPSSVQSTQPPRRKPLYPTSAPYELDEQDEDVEEDGETREEHGVTAVQNTLLDPHFHRTTSLLSPPTLTTTITTTSTTHPSSTSQHANSLPTNLPTGPYDMAADPPNVPRVPTNSPHNPVASHHPVDTTTPTTSSSTSRTQTRTRTRTSLHPAVSSSSTTTTAAPSLRTLSFGHWGRSRRSSSSTGFGSGAVAGASGVFAGFSSANSIAGRRTRELRNSRSFTSSVSARSVLGTGAGTAMGTGFGAFGSASTSASVSRGGDGLGVGGGSRSGILGGFERMQQQKPLGPLHSNPVLHPPPQEQHPAFSAQFHGSSDHQRTVQEFQAEEAEPTEPQEEYEEPFGEPYADQTQTQSQSQHLLRNDHEQRSYHRHRQPQSPTTTTITIPQTSPSPPSSQQTTYTYSPTNSHTHSHTTSLANADYARAEAFAAAADAETRRRMHKERRRVEEQEQQQQEEHLLHQEDEDGERGRERDARAEWAAEGGRKKSGKGGKRQKQKAADYNKKTPQSIPLSLATASAASIPTTLNTNPITLSSTTARKDITIHEAVEFEIINKNNNNNDHDNIEAHMVRAEAEDEYNGTDGSSSEDEAAPPAIGRERNGNGSLARGRGQVRGKGRFWG